MFIVVRIEYVNMQ